MRRKRERVAAVANANLVPRAHVPFGQHRDTELWNNQFPKTKILGLTVSRRMRGFVYMASRDKVDMDTSHKGIQYALEKLGKSNLALKEQQYQILKAKDTWALGTSSLIIPELRVLVLTKRHVGSENEIELMLAQRSQFLCASFLYGK